jgi:ADP-ribose pyrophosphatase
MTKIIETWKIKDSEIVADCKVFSVQRNHSVRDSDGAEFPFYRLQNTDWVNIIPITKAGEVVLIEQYRHGIEGITLEIPGGMVDEDEDAKVAAERELIEETGYVPKEMILLGKCHPNPAIQQNWVYHYLATDCEKLHEPEFDATESVWTSLVPLDDIQNLIADGKITHSLVIAAFYWLSLNGSKV